MPVYEREFFDYVESNLHPTGSVLANPCRRGSLRRLLSPGTQEDLFGDPLEVILERLSGDIVNRKGGYMRWREKIGEKERMLSVPSKTLWKFLEDYLEPFIEKQRVHGSCHGGIKGWSPKSSLESHLPIVTALSFDMESAFQNMPARKVFDFFYCSLKGIDNYEERRDIAGFLTFISTVRYDQQRGLPQGSPISQAIFNRLMLEVDETMFWAATERGMTYSRWVDDFTVSSPDRRDVREFLGAVNLLAERFPVARDKVYFQEGEPVYLLGHKLVGGRVLKNSREERLRNKTPPLDYYKWLSNRRAFEPWIN
ncbi:hypothetical protein HY500_00970 [Candidatus Woesearchaeota archaeon]|nr:hypothetical protein [Candidatus Woesearchaeota archaeon]